MGLIWVSILAPFSCHLAPSGPQVAPKIRYVEPILPSFLKDGEIFFSFRYNLFPRPPPSAPRGHLLSIWTPFLLIVATPFESNFANPRHSKTQIARPSKNLTRSNKIKRDQTRSNKINQRTAKHKSASATCRHGSQNPKRKNAGGGRCHAAWRLQ